MMSCTLHELCLASGIIPANEDETDCVYFCVDNLLFVMLEIDSETDRLSISCEVAVVDRIDQLKAMQLIAIGNFRFLQTDGSTIGIDIVSGCVVLERRETMMSLDTSNFPVIIESFLDCAEKWYERLNKLPYERDQEYSMLLFDQKHSTDS